MHPNTVNLHHLDYTCKIFKSKAVKKTKKEKAMKKLASDLLLFAKNYLCVFDVFEGNRTL